MSEADDLALDAAVDMHAPTPAPFDVSALTPVDAPPGAFTTPNHAAGDDADEIPEPEPGRRARRFAQRGKAPKAGKREKVTPPKGRPGALVRPLTQMYTSIGTVLIPFDSACGAAVISNAEDMAKSLDALARENDAVRRALMAMTQTSAWGGVLIAHLPLLLAIMAHHGPDDVKNTVAPLAVLMNGGMPMPTSGEEPAA